MAKKKINQSNKATSNGTAAKDISSDNISAKTGTSSAKAAPSEMNGENQQDTSAQLDPAVLQQISEIRTKVHETFGKVALAMTALPRYKNQTISDLHHILLNPLIRDRVAIASHVPSTEKGAEEGVDAAVTDSLTGIAIWASVSEEVDQNIREQIKAGVFPIRLKPEDWVSGNINWLLDVIAPNQRLTTSVIANFRQVIKEGEMRMHPLVARLVDPEALKKMGAAPLKTDAKMDDQVTV